jgi:hypothetical protein
MNLTVGPLPPGVYWRRRALVLGALVVVVALIVSMCGGSGEGKTRAAGPTGTATSTPSVQTPVIGGSGSSGTAASAGSAQPSATVEETGAAAPVDPGPPPAACLDSEMSLTVVAVVRKDDVLLQMKIKNISDHACTRDVGGTPQEIHVTAAASQPADPVVWSSDFCQAPNQPADVRTFGPGIESILPAGGVLWRKSYVATGCSVIKPAPPGQYSVAAKMGTLASPVIRITI